MFKKRRGFGFSRILGVVFFIIGTIMFIYILPSHFWLFILACLLMCIGFLFFNS
ncbi:hypothetical protein HZR23_11125 [Serpentinicella alkaliphila]|uniref:hypothetical protein n=1 Tax=Serpentinicella alkaliphila TaxID=1734049 RepID=UPI001BC863B7|nr:hypothetical protein [Serpentinicella alkaliphila]QUH26224.1 hypothetical protein HZR23_11125 [Serpentinicella alkaliphila]